MGGKELFQLRNMNKTVKNKPCCEVFDNIKDELEWFSFINDEEEKVFCMPCIRSVDGLLRVNYCPSCGKEVRGYTYKEEEQ